MARAVAPVYEQLLAHLRAQPSENQGLREFVQILGLHREYLPTLVEQAISQALTYGCAHLNGVRLCLRQLQYPEQPRGALDLTQRPQLAGPRSTAVRFTSLRTSTG